MKKILTLFGLVLIGTLMVVGIASAASTIGTNITTGGTLTVGGDITLQNSETISNATDGTVGITVSATGLVNVLTGNLKVGNGTPTVTQDGEDAYVEGTLEVDGAVRFDSTLEVNGNITLQNDETISNSVNGLVRITAASTTLSGNFAVDGTASSTFAGDIYVTKNLKVGNGTPTVTLNNEDAYIEGTLEVDGAVRFDSTLEVNDTITLKSNDTIKNDSASTTVISGSVNLTGGLDVQGGDITLQNDETISNSVNNLVRITAASTTLSGNFAVDGTASSTFAGDVYVTKALKVGNGSPTVALNPEAVYIEDTLEVDGAVRFDSTLEVNSDITLQNDETISNSVNGLVRVTAASTTLSGNFAVDGTASSTFAGDIYVTKNLKVGNGTPTVTLNNEDAYIEGTFEVDGAARFDGNVTVNGTFSPTDFNPSGAATIGGNLSVGGRATITAATGALRINSNLTLQSADTIKNESASTTIISGALNLTGGLDVQGGDITLQNDETISNSVNGLVRVTAASTTLSGNFAVDGTASSTFAGDIYVTKNIKVGSGSPDVTLNNGDVYIEGTLEVDGAVRFDGDLTLDTTTAKLGVATSTPAATLSVNTTAGVIAFAVGSSTANYLKVDASGDVNIYKDLKVGDGAPTVTQDGEDAYIEGTLEVDGAVRFDSTLEVNSDITLQNDETISNSTNGVIALTAASTTFSGGLGVGTTTPTRFIDVYTSGTTSIRFERPCFQFKSPDNTITYMWIKNNGNWGTSTTVDCR